MTEWKKLLRPASVIPALAMLLVLSLHLCGSMYSGETAFRDARIETYAFLETQSDPLEWALLYRDELDAQLEETQEQIMWSDDVDTTRSLLSEYKELQKQKGRFANTLGGDYLCLNAAIRSMQHINGLEQSWEAEIQTMKHAAKRLNDTALAKESLYLERSYQALRLPEFGNYEPADSWITWNGSYGCVVMLAVCFFVSFAFPLEKKSGMQALLQAIAVHPRRIVRRKTAYAVLFAVIIVTLLFAMNLMLTWYMVGDLWALSQPVQAVSCMQYSGLNLSIGQMLLVQYGLYSASSVLITGLTLLISSAFREAWIAFSVSAGVVAIPNVFAFILNCPQKYLLSGRIGAEQWLRLSPVYVCLFAFCAVAVGLLLTKLACRRFGGVRDVEA